MQPPKNWPAVGDFPSLLAAENRSGRPQLIKRPTSPFGGKNQQPPMSTSNYQLRPWSALKPRISASQIT
jgi:hypothetical protein